MNYNLTMIEERVCKALACAKSTPKKFVCFPARKKENVEEISKYVHPHSHWSINFIHLIDVKMKKNLLEGKMIPMTFGSSWDH